MTLENITKHLSLLMIGSAMSLSCGSVPDKNDDDSSKKTPNISIQTGYTENGLVTFNESDTNNPVEVFVGDKNNIPLSGVHVTYFDGNGFKAFQMAHPDFQPSLEIAAHNSNHSYSITSLPTILAHDSNEKERSRPAAAAFSDWVKTTGEYHGCRDKAEIDAGIEVGSYIVEKLLDFLTVGFLNEYMDSVKSSLKSTLEDNYVADFYSYRHINPATTTITSVEIRYSINEIPGNGIDDDCDSLIDENGGNNGGGGNSGSGGSGSGNSGSGTGGNPPGCQDECDYLGQKGCLGYENGHPTECGNFDNDSCLDLYVNPVYCAGIKKYCIDGECTTNY